MNPHISIARTSPTQATSIFEVILDFSSIVQKSKETWMRKARAAKRRATMNTPIKTSRSTPSKTPTKAKAKPQSPKLPNETSAPKRFESEDNKELMLKSIKFRMSSQTSSVPDIGNDTDAWDSDS